jgi:hypothetical protein
MIAKNARFLDPLHEFSNAIVKYVYILGLISLGLLLGNSIQYSHAQTSNSTNYTFNMV